MTREQLAAASELLGTAADETTVADASDRLAELSDQLSRLADAETEPDHGRLARIQASLDEISESVDAEIVAHIESALEKIVAYRENLEGV